jgi:FkbM family methyltransferase
MNSTLRRIKLHLQLLTSCLHYFGLTSGLATYLRFTFARVGQPIRVSIPECATPITLAGKTADVWMFEAVFLHRDYDYAYPVSPACIIDAGAHIGMTSLYFANRFPQSRILAIEPVPRNYAMLCENTRGYENIRTIQAALWDDHATLTIENPESQSSAFRVAEVSSCAKPVQAITVNDAFKMLDVEQVDLLKIDIEGSEKQVFSGDTSWLRNVKMMVIELHDRFQPGCTQALQQAIEGHEFVESPLGENLVLVHRSLLK